MKRGSDGCWSFGGESGGATDTVTMTVSTNIKSYGKVQMRLHRRLDGHTDVDFMNSVSSISHALRPEDALDPQVQCIVYYCQSQGQEPEAEACAEMHREKNKNMQALYDAMQATKDELSLEWDSPLLAVSVYSVKCGVDGANLQEKNGISFFCPLRRLIRTNAGFCTPTPPTPPKRLLRRCRLRTRPSMQAMASVRA